MSRHAEFMAEHQRDCAVQLKVAVLGPLGTYTHEAAYKQFGSLVNYEEQPTIAGVFHALTEDVSMGVVPQENSIFGSVIETYDLLRTSASGYVRGEVMLKVDHCLLVRKGVQMHKIEKVMSHEQALGQCQDFLAANLPSAITVKMPSTASAAQALLDNPPNCAAICSRICATLFDDLEILSEGIQRDAANFTRFYVIAHTRQTQVPPILKVASQRKALIRLSPSAHTPLSSMNGACSRDIMRMLRLLELNVARIDRRPSRDAIPFQDVYFIEVQANQRADGRVEEKDCWVSEVEQAVERIRVVGGQIDLIGVW